jgi:hypothetical protein
MVRIVAVAIWVLPLVAADPACQPLIDASNKLYTVPVHIYNTETAAYTGGKPRQSESIFLNDKTYVMTSGKWKLSPMSVQKMRALREKAETEGVTCRRLGDDIVNGEPAILFAMHQKDEDQTIDSKNWISKSRGLPLKAERDMDVGGTGGKSHSTTRYEYTNVQAPSSMQ